MLCAPRVCLSTLLQVATGHPAADLEGCIRIHAAGFLCNRRNQPTGVADSASRKRRADRSRHSADDQDGQPLIGVARALLRPASLRCYLSVRRAGVCGERHALARRIRRRGSGGSPTVQRQQQTLHQYPQRCASRPATGIPRDPARRALSGPAGYGPGSGPERGSPLAQRPGGPAVARTTGSPTGPVLAG